MSITLAWTRRWQEDQKPIKGRLHWALFQEKEKKEEGKDRGQQKGKGREGEREGERTAMFT